MLSACTEKAKGRAFDGGNGKWDAALVFTSTSSLLGILTTKQVQFFSFFIKFLKFIFIIIQNYEYKIQSSEK